MKKNKFIFVIILIVAFIIPISFSSVNAATGNQGYAVYRDNAFGLGGAQWHTGLMDEPSSTYSLPVLQARGFGYNVDWSTWTTFMGSASTFKGVYRPKQATTSANRDLFVALGRKLRGESISYNAYNQMYYSTSTAGTWVDTDEISSMRCDGVIEYIYEWYGFRVYGNDTYWDISKNSVNSRNYHTLDWVSPISQANYLYKVSSYAP